MLTENLKIQVAKMACFDLEMGAMRLIGKPSMVLYGQNVCHLLAFLAPQVITESTSLTTIKKDFCLLISYISFLCISISLVVPSGNSCVRLGVEHCISKLQVVEEFGLSPCRQHEVIFTWFIRYSFLHFASCIEFISQTSSVSPVRAEQ